VEITGAEAEFSTNGITPWQPRRRLVQHAVQRMNDHARTSCSTDAVFGWSFYARFYAWRFS
jgi:hypothetical protein